MQVETYRTRVIKQNPPRPGRIRHSVLVFYRSTIKMLGLISGLAGGVTYHSETLEQAAPESSYKTLQRKISLLNSSDVAVRIFQRIPG